MDAMVMVPGPDGYGWKLVDDELVIDWTDEKPAPDAVIEMMSCNCKKLCTLENRCSCHENGLLCTDMCKCTSCENKLEEEEIEIGAEEEECEESDDEAEGDDIGEGEME